MNINMYTWIIVWFIVLTSEAILSEYSQYSAEMIFCLYYMPIFGYCAKTPKATRWWL